MSHSRESRRVRHRSRSQPSSFRCVQCRLDVPTDAPGTYSGTGPFNPNFLADLRARRGKRLQAFSAYRMSLDPSGLFYNDYLRQLLEG